MLIVEMSAECYKSAAHRLFEVGYRQWDTLQEVAIKHGWEPAGTLPDLTFRESWWIKSPDADLRKRQDYKCPDIFWSKQVEAMDAYHWAEALERFLLAVEFGTDQLPPPKNGPQILSDALTADQHGLVNSDISVNLVREFVDFLKKGHFRFFWDD